jgi:hypothetical protein
MGKDPHPSRRPSLLTTRAGHSLCPLASFSLVFPIAICRRVNRTAARYRHEFVSIRRPATFSLQSQHGLSSDLSKPPGDDRPYAPRQQQRQNKPETVRDYELLYRAQEPEAVVA